MGWVANVCAHTCMYTPVRDLQERDGVGEQAK